MSKVPLFGISFDDIGMADAVEAALRLIDNEGVIRLKRRNAGRSGVSML